MIEQAQVNELLQKWSSKCTDSVEELKKQYEENFSSLKSNNQNQDDNYLQKIALSRISAKLRRQFSSNAKKFTGTIISYGNLYNASNKLLEKAKENNWVNENGEYVFKDYDWRMDKIIPKEDWQRVITGLAKLHDDKDGELRPFIMFVKRELALPKLNTKVVFRAGLKDNKISESVWPLGATSVTEFKDLGEPELSLKALAVKYFPKNCFKLADLAPESSKNSDSPIDLIFTKGTVARIVKTNETKKTNVLELADLDNMEVDENSPNVAAFLNKSIPIDFGEGSVVFITGSVIPNREDQSKIGAIMATGLWVEIRETPTNKAEVITPQNGNSHEGAQTEEKKDEAEPEWD